MNTEDIKQKITDQEDVRRYFAMIPHMADDDLDIHEYRLYGHYKRVCGENGGSCTESERTTCEHLGFSRKKLRSTRESLAEKSYIHFTPGKPKSKEFPQGRPAVVTCPSLWQQNSLRYMPETDKKEYLEQVIEIFGDDIIKLLESTADVFGDDDVEQTGEGSDGNPIGSDENPIGSDGNPYRFRGEPKEEKSVENTPIAPDETPERDTVSGPDPKADALRNLGKKMGALNSKGKRTARDGQSQVLTAQDEDAPDICAAIRYVWPKESKKFKVSKSVNDQIHAPVTVRNGLTYPSPNDLFLEDKQVFTLWLKTLPDVMKKHSKRFNTTNLMHYIKGYDYARVGYFAWRAANGYPEIKHIAGELLDVLKPVDNPLTRAYEDDPVYKAEQALLEELLGE